MNRNTTMTIVPEDYLKSRSTALVVLEATLLVIINVLSLCGNCLVVGAIYRSASLRTETNLLLVALAFSDIIMSIVAMPFSETSVIVGQWSFGTTACQIQGYCIFMLAFLSLQLMTLTAVSRYMKVVHPGRYKKIFTKRKTLLMIAVVCTITAGIIAALLFAKSNDCQFIFHPGKVICVPKFRSIEYSRIFTITYGSSFVLIPAFVISVCYLRILKTIRHQRKEYSSCRGKFDSKSILEKEEGKLTKIVLAIILGFAACWIPCVVIDLVDINSQKFLPREVYLTYTFLGYTSSLLNPILYGIMNKLVRREALNLLACRKRTESRSTWAPASTGTCANLITLERGSRETLKLSLSGSVQRNINLGGQNERILKVKGTAR